MLDGNNVEKFGLKDLFPSWDDMSSMDELTIFVDPTNERIRAQLEDPALRASRQIYDRQIVLGASDCVIGQERDWTDNIETTRISQGNRPRANIPWFVFRRSRAQQMLFDIERGAIEAGVYSGMYFPYHGTFVSPNADELSESSDNDMSDDPPGLDPWVDSNTVQGAISKEKAEIPRDARPTVQQPKLPPTNVMPKGCPPAPNSIVTEASASTSSPSYPISPATSATAEVEGQIRELLSKLSTSGVVNIGDGEEDANVFMALQQTALTALESMKPTGKAPPKGYQTPIMAKAEGGSMRDTEMDEDRRATNSPHSDDSAKRKRLQPMKTKANKIRVKTSRTDPAKASSITNVTTTTQDTSSTPRPQNESEESRMVRDMQYNHQVNPTPPEVTDRAAHAKEQLGQVLERADKYHQSLGLSTTEHELPTITAEPTANDNEYSSLPDFDEEEDEQEGVKKEEDKDDIKLEDFEDMKIEAKEEPETSPSSPSSPDYPHDFPICTGCNEPTCRPHWYQTRVSEFGKCSVENCYHACKRKEGIIMDMCWRHVLKEENDARVEERAESIDTDVTQLSPTSPAPVDQDSIIDGRPIGQVHPSNSSTDVVMREEPHPEPPTANDDVVMIDAVDDGETSAALKSNNTIFDFDRLSEAESARRRESENPPTIVIPDTTTDPRPAQPVARNPQEEDFLEDDPSEERSRPDRSRSRSNGETAGQDQPSGENIPPEYPTNMAVCTGCKSPSCRPHLYKRANSESGMCRAGDCYHPCIWSEKYQTMDRCEYHLAEMDAQGWPTGGNNQPDGNHDGQGHPQSSSSTNTPAACTCHTYRDETFRPQKIEVGLRKDLR